MSYITLTLCLTLTLILFSNHPLSLIMALILVSAILAIKTFMVTKISFMSYSIVLILLGGLIVLFIYMASLAPNEPFFTHKNKVMMMATLLGMMTLTMINPPNSPNEFFNFKVNIIMLYPVWVTLALAYLLITLIAVVSMTSVTTGPLRSSY